MSTSGDSAHTGISRTSVQRNHALITPESHVPVQLPGWQNSSAVVVISPEMGAKFAQLLVNCGAQAQLQPLAAQDELFVLVQQGSVTISFADERWPLQQDDFAYLPPELNWRVTSDAGAQLLVFSKPYAPLAGVGAPPPLRSSLSAVPAEAFLGDEGALLQVLLPDQENFDWGINLFEFVPGGTLPQVESHLMEHGLLVLAGQGVYRLGDNWYPVQTGDCIWMGPYLPQWYVAAGKTNSRYIYYKEMHRAPQQ